MFTEELIDGKRIVQPPYLKSGDKVAFISPAYWLAGEAILKAAGIQ